MAKHIRRRPGRKRKAGDRKPCGRLRYTPPEPNQSVIERRKALLGSDVGLHNAESPLNLAFARGWISERQFRAGAAFGRIHAGAGLNAPGLSGSGLAEADEGTRVEVRTWAELSDVEIGAIWNQVMNVSGPATTDEKQARSMDNWIALCAILTPSELREVELVCVHDSWPFWITSRCAGNMTSAHERKRDLLLAGLDKIAKTLFRAKEDAPTIEPLSFGQMNSAQPRSVVELTTYEDQDGNKLFEVERVSRRKVRAA
jgi:hypothetical protein